MSGRARSLDRPAGDAPNLLGDEPRLWAGGEGHRVRDVLWLSAPADRDGSRRGALVFGDIAAKPAGRGGVDAAGPSG